MSESNNTKITPLNAGVKPLTKAATAKKREFVLPERLTHRPFEGLSALLNTVKS